MRSGIIGFVLGVTLAALAAVVVQQRIIRDIKQDVAFRFDRYVFDEAEFPSGDFEAGRLVHRFLFPARFTITFYDAHYNEVAKAEKPGRYGAVVRMKLAGNEVDQFVTLYRTPGKVFWKQTPWPMSVQLPEAGLDPTVLRNQQPEIGEMLRSTLAGRANDSANLAILLAALSEISPSDPPALPGASIARNNDWWFGLRQRIGLPESYRHLVELPRDYDADPVRRWPVLLYLVGHAEFGNDLHLVRGSGIARRVADGQQEPAIIVAPQCPDAEEWNPKVLAQLLDEITAKYRVDPDRIYVTGGPATWDMALAYPERIAAILPITCESDQVDAVRLKAMPIWASHQVDDPMIPASLTIGMVDRIRQAGGHPHETITDGKKDVWEVVYDADSPVFPWLFAQKRGQPEVITPGVPTP